MTTDERTALRGRLTAIEAELDDAYLYGDLLRRPPILRSALALLARQHLPALLDAEDALAAAQAEAAAYREALAGLVDRWDAAASERSHSDYEEGYLDALDYCARDLRIVARAALTGAGAKNKSDAPVPMA